MLTAGCLGWRLSFGTSQAAALCIVMLIGFLLIGIVARSKDGGSNPDICAAHLNLHIYNKRSRVY